MLIPNIKLLKRILLQRVKDFFHLKVNLFIIVDTVPGSSTYMNDSNYKWRRGSKIGFETRTTFTDKKAVSK